MNRDLAIEKIEKDFEKMSNLVLEQLQLLEELFTAEQKEHPADIFKRLEKNEEKIAQGEKQLDDLIIQTIVLYKPVASDLRRLFAIYHMTINLERVGDLVLAVTTAENMVAARSYRPFGRSWTNSAHQRIPPRTRGTGGSIHIRKRGICHPFRLDILGGIFRRHGMGRCRPHLYSRYYRHSPNKNTCTPGHNGQRDKFS